MSGNLDKPVVAENLTHGAAFTKLEYEKWKMVITGGHITLG
jgi:hypothetical protein